MKTQIISAMTAITMFLSPVMVSPISAADKTVVTLNPADASPFNNGEFEGWGTSLCWWANRLGYSEKLTEAAADAFFSDEGLGLDIARYNLGGGDDPAHDHITRSDSKVPGIWSDFTVSEDGKNVDITEYDITKDQNQLNIAKAALAANPGLYFEGFSNSAPYFMTVTGCSSGGDPASSDNLKPDMYDDFGRYIAEATALFKEEGIEFQSYSPMNEPDTSYWGVNSNKQEGCHFDSGESQSKAIIETRKALDQKGLQDVLVAGLDETSIDQTIKSVDKLTEEAKAALGRLDTHSYSGSKRAELKAKAQQIGKTLWMSEVDKGGDGATLANMIIADMNGMQPAAWVMWDIVDFHKDSAFIAPDGSKPEANNSLGYTSGVWGVGMADHDNETLFLTNKYYAFGQFTKYINPRDTIIASSDNTLAAYNKKSGDIKIVANNTGSSNLNYEFDLSGFVNVGKTVKEIRTDMAGKEKWAEINGEAALDGKTLTTTLKANTVTTYIIENDISVNEFNATDHGLTYHYSVNDSVTGCDQYFVVYDNDGRLKAVTKNQPQGTLEGDFTNCNFKLMVWEDMQPKTRVVDTVSNKNADYAVIKGSGSEIKRGSEIQLTLATNMTGDVSWSVDNVELAEISQTGMLTAKKPGQITVTASLGGYSVSKAYDITVYADIIGANTVSVGKTLEFKLDTNAEGTPVWSVDNEEIATITQEGVLTALSAGAVTVTVTMGDFTAEKAINVTLYKLKGTPSWADASNAPNDNNDYLKAVDGDLNTYFDGTQNGYVMYDYGTPFKINSIKLAARGGNGMADRTAGAKIQGSNDGITWTDLYTIATAIPAGSYTAVSADQLINNNAYRYFRYTNDTGMTNIAEFLIDASQSEDVANGEPAVMDIVELTDDFENSSNIFKAAQGDLSFDGNQIYTSNLARYGNVFMPIKSTAQIDLESAVDLTDKDRFRLSFNIFAGWENNGKNNEFSILNSAGTEIIGFTVSGGGYNLNQMRIGGIDLLADVSDKPVFQCMSTDKRNGAFRGANGWDGSGQLYANNMGFNKTAEIIIDGTGTAIVKFEGGAADLSYTGTIDVPADIKSLIIKGDYNSSRGRVVSYDNFDADVISYSQALQ